MRIALFQPDIPQNTGTILRMAACLDVPVEIIGPAGFDLSDRALKRSGLDYLPHATLQRHESWDDFLSWRSESVAAAGRLILFTTAATDTYTAFNFAPDDILLFGRESAGAPGYVHDAADARLLIPVRPGLRSLNIAVAVAMALGEGLRQTAGFPAEASRS